MGETSVFECPACGYTSREIRWGVGSVDARIRFLPAFCRKCREMIEVDLTGRDVLVETFTCGACGSVVTFLQRSDTFDCPSCGVSGMRIIQKRYW